MSRKYARAFTIGMCDDPECSHVHIGLEDGEGTCFAEMQVDCDEVSHFVDDLWSVVHEIQHKTGKGHVDH